jgi:glycerol-3-phosphate acyltransferase PlsY
MSAFFYQSMNSVLLLAASGFTAYIIGSIPFAYLAGKTRGIDIRAVGSGNVGATNVFRSISKPLGVITFCLDMAKGFAASWCIPYMAKDYSAGSASLELPVFCAFSAIAGHNWSVFLKFKGGKGVATSAGALLGLAPLAVLAGTASWIVFFLAFRYVSLGSIVAAIVMPVCGWILYRDQGIFLPSALTIIGALAVWRHKPNIIRLLNGTEHRVSSGKTNVTPDAAGAPRNQGDNAHET